MGFNSAFKGLTWLLLETYSVHWLGTKS